MIIECSYCHARYNYDEARFEGKPSKKIRCAKCQEIFEIRNPKSSAPTTVTPSTRPGSHSDVFDLTSARGSVRRSAVPEPNPLEEAMAKAQLEDDEAAQASSQPIDPSANPLKMPEGRRISLAVIDGPDAGKVHVIDKPHVVIGRAASDIILNDGEASRNHAVIEVRDSMVFLIDLGSTNGTLVDGQPVRGSMELQNQGEFQIGTSTLMLIVTDTD